MTDDVMRPQMVKVVRCFLLVIASIIIAVFNVELFHFSLTIAVGFGPTLQLLVLQ